MAWTGSLEGQEGPNGSARRRGHSESPTFIDTVVTVPGTAVNQRNCREWHSKAALSEQSLPESRLPPPLPPAVRQEPPWDPSCPGLGPVGAGDTVVCLLLLPTTQG